MFAFGGHDRVLLGITERTTWFGVLEMKSE